MAAVTPVIASTAGGVDVFRGVYTGVLAGAEDLLAEGVRVFNRSDFVMEIHHFAAGINNGDTWTSNISGIQALAVQLNEETGQTCSAVLTTAASGTVTFRTDNDADDNVLWLWVLIDPSAGRRQGFPGK